MSSVTRPPSYIIHQFLQDALLGLGHGGIIEFLLGLSAGSFCPRIEKNNRQKKQQGGEELFFMADGFFCVYYFLFAELHHFHYEFLQFFVF